MKFVALLSGGKDSCYAMHLIARENSDNKLVALANLKPSESGKELDSYMYQTVGQDVLELQAKALNVPLYQRIIRGKPVNQQMEYNSPVDGDEVEDLYELLSDVRRDLEFDAVSCGAIHSNYQRLRAENVCSRLSIKLLSPLWGRNQIELLKEMIDSGIEALLIKTAALGLDPRQYLGQKIDQSLLKKLIESNEKYQLNVCGEGGEYESMTIGCPMFQNKKIIIDEYEIVDDGNDNQIVQVSYLKPIRMHLQ